MQSTRSMLPSLLAVLAFFLLSAPAQAQFVQPYCSSENTGNGDPCKYRAHYGHRFANGNHQIPISGSPMASAQSTATVRASLRLPLSSGPTAGAPTTFPLNRPMSASARKTALAFLTTSVVTRMRIFTSTSSSTADHQALQEAAIPHHLQQM